MPDYQKRLHDAQEQLRQRFYSAAIRECGVIIETGLKQLYHRLDEHCRTNGMADTFSALRLEFFRERKEDFQVHRAGLGGMLLFANRTRFWTVVKTICDSNLSFIRMIQWQRVRVLRNDHAHGKAKPVRNDAVEMMFYTKVFLYDCGFIEGVERLEPDVSNLNCPHCKFSIQSGYRYCPGCGEYLVRSCHECRKKLEPNHNICPHCDTMCPGAAEDHEARDIFRRYAEAVWADWEVTPAEKEWLGKKRLELGLSPEEAERIETSIIPKNYHQFMRLIEAVILDDKIDTDEHQFLLRNADELGLSRKTAEKLIQNAKNNQTKRVRKKLLGLV